MLHLMKRSATHPIPLYRATNTNTTHYEYRMLMHQCMKTLLRNFPDFHTPYPLAMHFSDSILHLMGLYNNHATEVE